MRIAVVVLAALCSYAGQTGEDEAALLRAAGEHPETFAANRRVAQFYLGRNELTKALPWLEKAELADPANYDNGYDLALARLETRDLVGARRVIEKLMARADRGELHNLLGDVEEASGNFDAAGRQYEAAARMDPSEKNLFDLGTDLLRHHALPQALVVFRYAAPLFPSSTRIQVGFGIALYSEGLYKEAIEVLCRAVDLDPKDTKALSFLGGMYDVAPELTDEVTRRLARFADLYPDNAAANYYYALSLRARTLTPGVGGSRDKVETLLRKAVALDPKFADAHYQLGLLYADEEQTGPAVRELEAAARLRPDLKNAHYRLFRLYSREGRTDLARKELDLYKSLKQDK